MTLPSEDLAHVQEHMRSWDKLRGKRIFLTGASGFVGTWLVESLAWANQNLDLGAELYVVTRAQREGTSELPHGDFDYGIHLAKTDDFRTDIEGTKRILDFAAQRAASRFLFTSSGAVYGKLPPDKNNVSEDYPGTPEAPTGYAQAKRAAESLCAQYADQSGFSAVLARLFAFLGPALPLDMYFAVGNFVRDVISGGPVIIEGDGTERRSYLYAADMAIWLWTLLLEGTSCRPYNVGSPDAISICELAQAIVGNTIPETQIVIKGRKVGGAGSVYVPSVERARTELQLQPVISLTEGIRRMYQWNVDLKSAKCD